MLSRLKKSGAMLVAIAAMLPLSSLNAANLSVSASVTPSCTISGSGAHTANFVPPLSSDARLSTNTRVTTNTASFAVVCNSANYKLQTTFANNKNMVNAGASPVAGFAASIPINRAILRKDANNIIELLANPTLNTSPVLPIMNDSGYQIRFILGPVAQHLQAGDYSESITITVISA
jgi:hypothetical protein